MATASERSFQLQLQMKRNTEEMSDFLKDMSDWTHDVKKADENLLTSTDNKTAALPPVRSQRKPRKKKTPTVTFEEESINYDDENGGKKGDKIRAYDYRAWDKFDVDAALKEVDGEAKESSEAPPPSSEDEGSTDEEEMAILEEERKQQQAVYHKERGNEFFKQGKWEDAVECYTKGLQQDSLNAVLFANRAMALLKLHKYAAAIADCDCSLELDDMYTKAYLRRATAHLKLENKDEALVDFKKVLDFEPENKLALSAVKKLDAELTPVEEYVPQRPGDITHKKRTAPLSDKPMIRICIYDITPDDYDVKPKKKGIVEIPSGKESHLENNGEKGANVSTTKPKENVVEFLNLPSCAPGNSLQFHTDVRKLKNHPEKLFQYFKQIDPDIYPKLFQDSLEADQLFMILDILEKFYLPNKLPVYYELYYLTKVKRFNMAVMFKSMEQELTIGNLLEYAAETTDNKEGIIQLIKDYSVFNLIK